MNDPELLRFVEALESYLAARRGREQTLTRSDFALARSWFEARLPLVTVLSGLDAAFAGPETPRTLAQCRRFVERTGER